MLAQFAFISIVCLCPMTDQWPELPNGCTTQRHLWGDLEQKASIDYFEKLFLCEY